MPKGSTPNCAARREKGAVTHSAERPSNDHQEVRPRHVRSVHDDSRRPAARRVMAVEPHRRDGRQPGAKPALSASRAHCRPDAVRRACDGAPAHVAPGLARSAIRDPRSARSIGAIAAAGADSAGPCDGPAADRKQRPQRCPCVQRDGLATGDRHVVVAAHTSRVAGKPAASDAVTRHRFRPAPYVRRAPDSPWQRRNPPPPADPGIAGAQTAWSAPPRNTKCRRAAPGTRPAR